MKMKVATVALAALTMTVSAGAQQKYSYAVQCGKKASDATITVTGNSYSMEDIDRSTRIINNSSNHTVEYHVKSTDGRTDATVTLKDGRYHVTGKAEGKSVDRTFASDGKPWIQHIAYVASKVIKGSETIAFGCFRPDNLDYQVLTAKISGPATIGGRQATELYVAPEGVKAKFWHCNYYIDPQSGFMAGYKAVEGGPGTPTTTWILKP